MSNQDDLSRLLFGMPNLCSGVVSNRRATGPSRFCIKIDVRGARRPPITGQTQVMGHSQAEKAATHQRIVDVAARRFRELGLDGIGVADVMKEAGMTVGGFSNYFYSRADRVTEATRPAF